MNFSHEKNPGKNMTGLIIVIILHAIVAYGIVTGLGKRMVTKMAEAVETKIIDEQRPPPPKEVPPPPPPPEMKAPPPPFIPPVEVNVQQPAQSQSPIAVSTSQAPANKDVRPAPPAPAKAAGPSNIPAVVDFNTCARPEYPRAAQRNEEQGTTVLQFLIGADGSVKESRLQKSSGFRDLDKAAQSALGRCRFKPGIVDGKPQEGWTSVQYVWTLE